ncbi:MAG: hypothetical protein IK066_09325, partial [Kiritimatiellae bacterium]|nr:hypothetical protein [Kiritimatiellia bacterium]
GAELTGAALAALGAYARVGEAARRAASAALAAEDFERRGAEAAERGRLQSNAIDCNREQSEGGAP